VDRPLPALPGPVESARGSGPGPAAGRSPAPTTAGASGPGAELSRDYIAGLGRLCAAVVVAGVLLDAGRAERRGLVPQPRPGRDE